MSCRWNITFLATGDLLIVKGLEEALPFLFDVVIEAGSVSGGLLAQVAQYYGAAGAMGDLIASYPDLFFNGVMRHEQAVFGGTYLTFTGAKGETDWHEYPILQDDRPATVGEIQDAITRFDKKVARLSELRIVFRDALHKLEAQIETPDEQAGGSESAGNVGISKDAADVTAILGKIKDKRHAN